MANVAIFLLYNSAMSLVQKTHKMANKEQKKDDCTAPQTKPGTGMG
jgi:hypothetical protein